MMREIMLCPSRYSSAVRLNLRLRSLARLGAGRSAPQELRELLLEDRLESTVDLERTAIRSGELDRADVPHPEPL